MHGADAALQWLQRDLGIYVVGLYDTGQAANPHPNPSPRPNQVLTHSLPFTGMNPVQIGLAVREQKLRPPLPDDCPAGFGTLLRDCWHDEPHNIVFPNLQVINQPK